MLFSTCAVSGESRPRHGRVGTFARAQPRRADDVVTRAAEALGGVAGCVR